MVKRLGNPVFVCLSILVLFSGFMKTTSGLNQKGSKSYEEKRYVSALDSYRKAQIKSPDNPTVRYNLGTTLYQLDQFQEAEMQLQFALANAKTKELKATAWYNYGNTQYRLGQFDKAIEAYKEVLELNPNDKDAKFNLELLQKKKRVFESKQNKRDSQRKDKPPQSQQQQKQEGGGGHGQEKSPSQGQGDQGASQGQEEGKEEHQVGRQQGEQIQEKTEQKPEERESEEKKKDAERQESPKGKEEGKPLAPARFEPGGEEQKPEEDQEQEKRAPILQGQMSQENALRILSALKESEQELQLLRRPRKQSDQEPLKDW